MAKPTQRDIAEKAQELKEEGEQERGYLKFQEDTPNEGMAEKTRDEHAARGQLDAEGHRPVLERSRKVR
ncbi:hypothetical protein J4558_23065 [Leptolyngbya sp. 15MV]|nr:hypothetical protein J4558_23065 [Leptolyngbya sp. 15MV]